MQLHNNSGMKMLPLIWPIIKIANVVILMQTISGCSSTSSSIEKSVVQIEEWIVTDPDLIHSDIGVPLNLSYTEKNNESDCKLPSAPGCPKSVDGLPWVYFGNPLRCHLVGTSGACPPGQLLFGNLTWFGHCDCLCPEASLPSKEFKLRLTSSKNWNEFYGANITEHSSRRFCTLTEALEVNGAMLDMDTGSCYYLETQGPCKPGEWIVKDESGYDFICSPRCSLSTGPHATHYFDYSTRKCVKKVTTSIQPVALVSNIDPRVCEDGMAYSKMLNKCIPKSKAYFIKIK